MLKTICEKLKPYYSRAADCEPVVTCYSQTSTSGLAKRKVNFPVFLFGSCIAMIDHLAKILELKIQDGFGKCIATFILYKVLGYSRLPNICDFYGIGGPSEERIFSDAYKTGSVFLESLLLIAEKGKSFSQEYVKAEIEEHWNNEYSNVEIPQEFDDAFSAEYEEVAKILYDSYSGVMR